MLYTDEKSQRAARELSYGSAVRAVGSFTMLAATAALSGCVRELLDDGCPEIAPGELVVTEIRVDYGFAGDFHRSWRGAAAVDVEACAARIDLAQYDSLQVGGAYPGTPRGPNLACP